MYFYIYKNKAMEHIKKYWWIYLIILILFIIWGTRKQSNRVGDMSGGPIKTNFQNLVSYFKGNDLHTLLIIQ